jgi:DNA (cytosine-5)-methyltransferase 1
MLLGHVPVCAVEIEQYCRSVLLSRQADGCLPEFPIWDDVKTFDGKPWCGHVDIVAGGFPCQDISCAGKGAGITGERSGLWSEMARIIGEVRPRYVFVENSPLLIRRGLTTVLGDLAQVGFNAQWCCVSAENVGAPHCRDRVWVFADADNKQQEQPQRKQWGKIEAESSKYGETEYVAYAEGITEREQADQANAEPTKRRTRDELSDCGEYDTSPNKFNDDCRGHGASTVRREQQGQTDIQTGKWWTTEPDVGRVAHGVASRVDRLKAIGNGQVPQVAALAWEMMSRTQE